MGESDETLMQKFKDGDERTFMEIMRRYQHKIFNFFLRQLHDYALSEDLTQDVFIRVYKYGQSFDNKRSFKPWLYKIAQVMNSSESTIKSRLYQAFIKLRKKLKKFRR